MATKRTRQIISDLRIYIVEKAIAPGDQLPSERDLSQQLACSRETLRKALDELERAGDIWRHVGQGTFYGMRPLGHPIRDAILVQRASPHQLMQARLTIEPSVAAEAAKFATPAEVAHLSSVAERGRHAATRSECEQLDAAFHRSLAEVTGNPILLGLLDYLAGVRRHATWQREWELTYRRLGVAEFTEHHSLQHQAVVESIAKGSANETAAAMRHHLETVFESMRRAERPS